MATDKFDINALTLRVGAVLGVISFVVAILSNEFLLPGRGRIVFFSSFVSLGTAYTASPMLKYIGAKIFLVSYVLLHLALVALPFTHDSDYASPILLPFLIADYVLMVFGLRWCTLATMRRQSR